MRRRKQASSAAVVSRGEVLAEVTPPLMKLGRDGGGGKGAASDDQVEKRKKYRCLSYHLHPRVTSVVFAVTILLISTSSWVCSAHAQSVPALPTFSVRATPTRLTTTPPANATLLCHASGAAPILCLWRTPYGHVYTLSEGVFAEGGRLRHLRPRAGSRGCGLEIVGVEARDAGEWECEVGAVVGEDFMTRRDEIVLDVKTATRRALEGGGAGGNRNSLPNRRIELQDTGGISVNTDGRSGLIRKASTTSASSSSSAVQEVGDDVILNCSADRKVDLCRWKTPYLNTYIVGEGIYVERGRIAWKGDDADFDCTIQVSNLELRDGGVWVCEIGSNIEDDFQVQTKEFQIEIETPLKLSAPTSLMQNANTDAMLVCHANKPFDRCLWTTPYGVTYAFPTPETRHEDGRIAFFGFSDNDCGVIVHQVGPDDNGGWQCQLHSTAGDIFQNATDVVPLFTDSDGVTGGAQPRAIQDYDYDASSNRNNNRHSSSRNRNRGRNRDDDDFGDFGDRDPDEPTAQDSQRKPVSVQVIRIDDSLKEVPGIVVTDLKRIGSVDDDGDDRRRNRNNGSGRKSTTVGFRPTVPVVEISKLTTSPLVPTPRTRIRPRPKTKPPSSSTTSPLSIFSSSDRQRQEQQQDPNLRLSGVNPIELELLSRISGTRRGDARPVEIQEEEDSSEEEEEAPRRSSSPGGRTRIRLESSNIPTERNSVFSPTATTTPSSPETRERMRLLEIQRIRDERRRKALEKAAEEEEEAERRRLEEEREEERKKELEARRRKEAAAREERRRKELEERRRKDAEDRRRKEMEARKRKEEEKRRKEEAEKEAQRKRELEERRRKEREEKRRREREEKRRRELEEKRRRELEDKRRREQELLRIQEHNAKVRKEAEERALQRQRELEEKRQKLIEEKRAKEAEERRLRQLEEERRKKEKEDQERKEAEEARQKAIEEERQRKLEEERQKRLEEEKKKKEEEEAKRREEERQRQIEIERKRKAAERRILEERRRLMAQQRREQEERERKELEEKLRKEAEEKRKEEEERKEKEEEERKRIAERRKKEEEERKAEIERLRKEEEEKARIEAERRRELEEKRKLEDERRRVQAQRRMEEQRRRIEAERKKKEDEENARRLEVQRRREELERKRKEESIRKRKEEEERQKRLEEERQKELEKRKKEEEEKARREEDIRRSLERIREEKRQREIAEKREQERLRKIEEEEAKEKEERRAQQVERERQRQRELQEEIAKRVREDEERRQREREDRERKEEELERRKKIREERIREQLEREKQQQQASPRSLQQDDNNGNVRIIDASANAEGRKRECTMSSQTPHGNITCGPASGVDLDPVTADYHVPTGGSCSLTCQRGYVSLDARENHCVNGLWTVGRIFACVRPDALLLVGGRSDTYGVLSTVELVTARGVCRGAVPELPAMRWRMVTATVDRDKVMTCAGVNIFGDPKTDCWTLGLDNAAGRAEWSKSPSMNVARDAAAWAFEEGFFVVMGGSLGKLNGYTDSVEMFSVASQKWIEGPSMSSSRYSHCAVPLGNGSIVVTGGYGGLALTERLDLDTGRWYPLPELNPVRAQHGCALVNVGGEDGVIVVGGDSGGTRLKDVRFLSLSSPREWQRMPELNTARWGRPAVGVVGGRVTVAAGWDGTRDLDTVEWYDERRSSWRLTSSRLQTERRWPSATPISLSLFPTCVQKRQG